MVDEGDSDADGHIDVTFALPGKPHARASVVGDFNNWDPHLHPFVPNPDGTRQVTISVAADRSMCFRYLEYAGECGPQDTDPRGERWRVIDLANITEPNLEPPGQEPRSTPSTR